VPGVGGDTPGASVLIRDAATDMFSLGTAEALRKAATLGDDDGGPGDPAAVDRALATVAGVLAVEVERIGDGIRLTGHDRLRLGEDALRVRIALAAEGVASSATPDDRGVMISLRPAIPQNRRP